MIQAGYPPKMLQAIMGHASITTTLDLYGHLYPATWTATPTASTARPRMPVRPK
jgi:integrase